MLINKKFYFIACLSTIFLSLHAHAVPSSLSFQSKIYKPDGNPLEAASVNFRFSTVDPTGTCILYVEDFSNVSLAGSAGLAILNLGTGTKVFPTSAYTFKNVFNNLSPSYNCQGGGTYSPSVGGADNRKIIAQFFDGSGSGWQTLPAIDVNSVPFANYAGDSEKFAGYVAADFLRFSTLPVCAGSDVLTYNGTSFLCVAGGAASVDATTTTKGVVQIGAGLNVATGVVSLADIDAAKITTGIIAPARLGSGTPGAGNFLRGDGAWANIPAGTVSSVSSANAYLSVATGTTTPALTVNVGTAANTVAAGDDSRISGALQASTYALDVADAVSCLTSEKPYWNTVSDKWMCVVLSDTSKLPLAGGAMTGAVISSAGTAAAPSVGVGQTTSGLFSSGANILGLGTAGLERMRIDASGNVGIGTLAPGAKLDVKGAIRLSGSTSGYAGFQPAAVAGSTVWTLPAADGSANQVLKTDGAGILGWVTPGPSGSGTAGKIAKFSAATTLADSILSESGTALTVGGTINSAYGTAAAPAFSFALDPDTGIYGGGFGYIYFASDGVSRMQVSGNGLQMSVPIEGMSLSSTAAAPAYAFTGTGNDTGIFNPAVDVFATSTAGVERMRIDAAGNVGIATTSPGAPLEILKNAVGPTFANGLLLNNLTPAVNGTGQGAPVLTMKGQAWDTGTSASVPVEIKLGSPAMNNVNSGNTVFKISSVINGSSLDFFTYDTYGNIDLSLRTTSESFNANNYLRAYGTYNAAGAVQNDGLQANTRSTASAVAPSQYAPRIKLRGSAWDTGTTSAKTSDWLIETTAVGGNPVTGILNIGYSLAGAAASYPLSITNIGNVGIGTANPSATLDVKGHVANTGNAATVGTCGTTPTITGNDTRGAVTIGTGTTTSCVVTFNSAFSTAPFCTITWRGSASTIGVGVTSTTTALTINFSAVADGLSVNYNCMQ